MDLSVIIPCYNREHTIERAINSILNQSYFSGNNLKFEIIVIDDCSTDHSFEVVKNMHNLNVRIEKLPKNMGGNYARNYGVRISEGKYIAFQDSDDEWLPEKLEKQFQVLSNYEQIDVVFSSVISDDEGEQTIVPEGISEGKVIVNDFLSSNKMSTQVLLGRRECFVEQPFDETLTRFQDWELALRLSQNYNMFFIKEPLAIQYIQTNSITRNNQKAYDSLIKIEQLHKEIFMLDKKNYSELLASIAYFAAVLKKNDTSYLKKSLQEYFSLSVFIKFVLSKFGLYTKFVEARK